MRPLGYLSPTVRNTRHAAAQLLAGPATPGPWGALVDLKRLMLASRVWGTAVIGLVVAVDPVVALLVQALCSYLSAANTGYCTTQVRRAWVKQCAAARSHVCSRGASACSCMPGCAAPTALCTSTAALPPRLRPLMRADDG